jgi:hypothetical protein
MQYNFFDPFPNEENAMGSTAIWTVVVVALAIATVGAMIAAFTVDRRAKAMRAQFEARMATLRWALFALGEAGLKDTGRGFTYHGLPVVDDILVGDDGGVKLAYSQHAPAELKEWLEGVWSSALESRSG